MKVLNKRLGDDVYKKKGLIEELHDQYTASIRMLDSKEKVKVDQSYLETVIPAIGEGERGRERERERERENDHIVIIITLSCY